MSNIKPFTINVPDNEIQLLKTKLSYSRFPDELQDAQWDYGVPLADIKRLVEFWSNDYDWKKHEKRINDNFAQFTIDIEVEDQGVLNVHFVHKRSEVEGAIPLLFVHGWPGSFMEVSEILPLLVQGGSDHPAFHVVALGLPGFGFSEAPKKKGFGRFKFAEVGHKLMLALGYNQYVAQGGDWGAWITRELALGYGPNHCKAIHQNMVLLPPDIKKDIQSLTEVEKARLERIQMFQAKGRGYFHEQSTQPQTLGYSLSDSPIGLLAWVYEKLHNWTDSYPFTHEEILNWISLYWFSRAGPAASVRIYYEYVQAGDDWKDVFNKRITEIPIGFSVFPADLNYSPKAWRAQAGNVVFDKEHSSGGHFAAFEKPEELVNDLREMFGKNGGAYGAVSNATGY